MKKAMTVIEIASAGLGLIGAITVGEAFAVGVILFVTGVSTFMLVSYFRLRKICRFHWRYGFIEKDDPRIRRRRKRRRSVKAVEGVPVEETRLLGP